MINFFIHRPVFAWVLAIIAMLAGAFSYTQLPVSQYPEIAPTTVRIVAKYPGATAEAVQNSVTKVIEDEMTGLDGMLYMESTSSKGRSTISLTFDESIDAIDAQNEVQVKEAQIESQLPDSVINQGVQISHSTSSILMVGTLVSKDNKYSAVQLGDLNDNTVKSAIQRTQGVGSVQTFGSGYAMRIWLDPLKLAQYQLTANDVTDAVEAQNTTVSVGTLGDTPTTRGQQFTATITAQSQLKTVEQFENILLTTEEDGSSVYLGDVARVELGQEDYGINSYFEGSNAAGFGVNLATGANAVQTAANVRATMEKLKASLPGDVEIEYPYDTAPFVQLSIDKVYHTLGEAIVLVLIVILVFLQKWRATLIPMVAVPVVLMGTFTVLLIAGYSINTLTMFAMVLAIGLLVDDAIVVVENVERVMEHDGLDPLPATIKGMSQITGALVGIATVLSAVFLPMAFMGGSTGVIYRQFSVTIITAMILSAIVALILSPALCATLLRRSGEVKFAPAHWFNQGFDKVNRGYSGAVKGLLKIPYVVIIVLFGIVAAAGTIFVRLPSSFLPTEDQGVLIAIVQLSEGSTTAQTKSVVQRIDNYFMDDEKAGVDAVFSTLGFGFSGTGQNNAMVFIKLKDFDQRQSASLSASAIAARANGKFFGDRAGQIFIVEPPAIPGIGNTSGFSMYLVDQANNGFTALRKAADKLKQEAQATGKITNVRITGDEDQSILQVNIDQQKAESLGLTLSDVNSMLSTIFGGTDVNDFNKDGNLDPVYVQGDAPYRMQPDDINKWYARNSDGDMVPFSAFMTTDWVSQSPKLSRYDGVLGMSISGEPTGGASSGDAMTIMKNLAEKMDGGYSTAWTGLSYQEQQSGDQAPYLYALAVIVVFLALAALYESWSIPFSVMLSVPVGVLGAVIAASMTGQDNDVYFKVGILTTIGLAAKNAILIVEFATKLEEEGMKLLDATVEAAKMRLRPILMTSFAFMLGVVPLATANGAGAAAQNAIGIGVLGGMIASTFIGVFMVPAFYIVIRRLSDKDARRQIREARKG